MRTTRQLSITLPNDMADALTRARRLGRLRSESEVVRDGLRALFAQEKAVESWLRTEVAEAYDELHADPSRAISSDEMRKRMAAHHAQHATDNPS